MSGNLKTETNYFKPPASSTATVVEAVTAPGAGRRLSTGLIGPNANARRRNDQLKASVGRAAELVAKAKESATGMRIPPNLPAYVSPERAALLARMGMGGKGRRRSKRRRRSTKRR